MPFDPTKPANNSPNSSAEMRVRLASLNADIQTRATLAQLAAEIGGTSANSAGVGPLGMAVSDPPTQAEVQTIADKRDELINALRRQGQRRSDGRRIPEERPSGFRTLLSGSVSASRLERVREASKADEVNLWEKRRISF